MKKLLILSTIAFLFQGCFTYKVFDNTPDKMVVGRTYKIQRNNKYERVNIENITETDVTISTAGRKESIPLSEITKVKSRKFSIVKTAALPVSIVAGLVGLAVIAWQ